MKLIHKETFKIKIVTEQFLTTQDRTKWAIIDETLVTFPIETDEEGISIEILPKSKYISGITTEDREGELFSYCTTINEYVESAKLIIDQKEEEDRINKEDFKYKKYKVITDLKNLVTNPDFAWLYSYSEGHPDIITKQKKLDVDTVQSIAFMNNISDEFMTIITGSNGLITLETNPYYTEPIVE